MTGGSYAAQVAADVAARYGVPVAPAAVQIIPRGVSSDVLPVWDGSQLVYSEESRISWRKQRAASFRNSTASPKAIERVLKVRDLHAEGLHDKAIADALQVSQGVIASDRNRLKLAANPCKLQEINTETRNARIRALMAQGYESDAIGAELGLSASWVRQIVRHELQLSFAPVSKAKAAPKPKVAKIAKPRPEKLVLVRAPRVVVAKVPRPLSMAKQRRAVLAALIAGLGRDLTRDDLDAHSAAAGVSIKVMRRDIEDMGMVWPRRPMARKLPHVRLSPVDRVAARDARREVIKAMDLSNMTVSDLVRRFEVTKQTIGSDLEAVGKHCKVPKHAMTAAVKLVYDAHQAKIAKMHAEGKGRSEIQLATGLSRNAVTRHVKALGLTLPRGYVNPWANRKKPGMSDRVKKLRAQLVQLRAEGKTYAQIIAITGQSKSNIGAHLRDLGLTGPQGTQGQRVAA